MVAVTSDRSQAPFAASTDSSRWTPPAPPPPSAPSDQWEHEHVHRFDEGERRFRHSHRPPTFERDENAAKPHAHKNGRHSHPHMDHGLYPVRG